MNGWAVKDLIGLYVWGHGGDKGDEAVTAVIMELSLGVPLWWTPGVTQLVLSGALLPRGKITALAYLLS